MEVDDCSKGSCGCVVDADQQPQPHGFFVVVPRLQHAKYHLHLSLQTGMIDMVEYAEWRGGGFLAEVVSIGVRVDRKSAELLTKSSD